MEELRMSFNITEEDLSVYRTIEICKRAGDESDEFFDAVSDIVDDDYKGLLNAIDDANSFQVVRQLVEAKAAKPKL
jgi:hypothetical protein